MPVGIKLVAGINGFHFLGLAFAIIIAVMLIIAKLHTRAEDLVQEDVKAVDMTPWKHGKLAGIVLCLLVVLIYAKFADFSALGNQAPEPAKPALEQSE